MWNYKYRDFFIFYNNINNKLKFVVTDKIEQKKEKLKMLEELLHNQETTRSILIIGKKLKFNDYIFKFEFIINYKTIWIMNHQLFF